MVVLALYLLSLIYMGAGSSILYSVLFSLIFMGLIAGVLRY